MKNQIIIVKENLSFSLFMNGQNLLQNLIAQNHFYPDAQLTFNFLSVNLDNEPLKLYL